MIRQDNDERQRKVSIAREIIYEKKYAIDNDNVKALLKEQSLVPTLVRLQILPAYIPLSLLIYWTFKLERFFQTTWSPWPRLFLSPSRRSHARV